MKVLTLERRKKSLAFKSRFQVPSKMITLKRRKGTLTLEPHKKTLFKALTLQHRSQQEPSESNHPFIRALSLGQLEANIVDMQPTPLQNSCYDMQTFYEEDIFRLMLSF